jgi:hypothetical protein
VNRNKLLASIVVFGSIWGMLECILGSVKLTGALASFPMGALLGGFFGLGLMAMTRRVFGVAWMQLGMGVVAGLLRFWAPIGTCVVCSALAIVAESLVFELIFNARLLAYTGLNPRQNAGGVAGPVASGTAAPSFAALVPLGVIAAYTIYVSGYIFTQIFTPILTTGTFSISDFSSVLPLILGRGFFAAMFGAVALPIAVLYGSTVFDSAKSRIHNHYAASAAISACCWIVVVARFWL